MFPKLQWAIWNINIFYLGTQGPKGVAGFNGEPGEKGDPGLNGMSGNPGQRKKFLHFLNKCQIYSRPTDMLTIKVKKIKDSLWKILICRCDWT